MFGVVLPVCVKEREEGDGTEGHRQCLCVCVCVCVCVCERVYVREIGRASWRERVEIACVWRSDVCSSELCVREREWGDGTEGHRQCLCVCVCVCVCVCERVYVS